MGSRTVRITSQDFLIPPEFQGRRLAERSAGQIGGAALELVERGGKTVIGHGYQQVPIRFAPAFHFNGEPAALVYLIVPTTGLMNGDGHLLEIDVGPGARVVVTGQSANRVHPSLGAFGTQQWRVRVADGGQLVVLPGPTIPYRDSRYFQHVRVELEGDARLAWGDIWFPGRYARGDLSEFYQFAEIVQDMEVHRDGALVHRERFHWDGPWDQERARWLVGDGAPGEANAASATLFLTGGAPELPEAPAPLQRAALRLEHEDTLVRWCGPAPMLVDAMVRSALTCAAAWPPEPSTRPWLIGGHHLGPSHWFSDHSGRT